MEPKNWLVGNKKEATHPTKKNKKEATPRTKGRKF